MKSAKKTSSRIISSSPKETKDLGINLAKNLKGGEVLLLFGNLGAGKTLFLQGLAQGLGVKGQVNSPTFNILKLYKFKKANKNYTFCHIDAYRLSSIADLYTLGIEEIWRKDNSITAIEWAENISDIVHSHFYKIVIKPIGKDKREIVIENYQ